MINVLVIGLLEWLDYFRKMISKIKFLIDNEDSPAVAFPTYQIFTPVNN